jgi:hypothetical protein
MNKTMVSVISLGSALVMVVGGVLVAEMITGSNDTPGPQLGMAGGWGAYLLGRKLVLACLGGRGKDQG